MLNIFKRLHQLKPLDYLVLLRRQLLRRKTRFPETEAEVLQYKPFVLERNVSDAPTFGNWIQFRYGLCKDQPIKSYSLQTSLKNSEGIGNFWLNLTKGGKQTQVVASVFETIPKDGSFHSFVQQRRLFSRDLVGKRRAQVRFAVNTRRTFVSFPQGQSWLQRLKVYGEPESFSFLILFIIGYLATFGYFN